jgi:PAS domain S-box-containing protein
MGHLIRGFDWSATPLGDPSTWPVPLRTALRVLLTTNHPIFLFWGPDHICFYNDAYKQSLGPEKHPAMLGAKGREAWDEIWDIIGPQVEQVMAGRGATWHENHLVPITRFGRREEVYWTYSYGPIDDEGAETGVGGVLVICTETTAQVRARRAAQEEAQRQRRLFQAAPGFIAILNGPDHVFEFVNAAYARLFGGREFVGKSVREVFPDIEGQGVYELLDAVYTTGERFVAERMEVRLRSGPGTPHTPLILDFIYEPILDEDDNVTGIFVEGYDVTDRARAEEQARFQAHLLEVVEQAVIATDLSGTVTYWNRFAERLYGWTANEALGRNILDLNLIEGAKHEAEARLARQQTGESWSGELTLQDRSGRRFPGEVAETPIRNASGHPIGTVAVSTDISARRKADEQRELLINELNHRVKNTLATVQSIASQTLRNASSPERAKEALETRLIALSRAHDVLTRENWEGANVHEIVTQAVEPYQREGRLHIRGPKVRVSPRMALALAMALQELAPNAVKYGALANSSGEVTISWALDTVPTPAWLRLRWEEKGGPLVEPPKRRGFGSRLMERSIEQDLGGMVQLDFASSGLVCVIEAPLGGDA